MRGSTITWPQALAKSKTLEDLQEVQAHVYYNYMVLQLFKIV